MRRRWLATLSLPFFGSLTQTSNAADARFEQEIKRLFSECRLVADLGPRARCYEAIEAKLAPPRWSGRLSFTTEPFTVDRPTTIRFESEGVIFVMYVRDARDEVVQNLHIGGGGEATYLIENPGTYTLQINGAEAWRVWLEP